METSDGDNLELHILPVVLNSGPTRPYIKVRLLSVRLGLRGSLVGYVSVSCEEGEMQTAEGDKPELNIKPVVPYIQVRPLSVS